MKNESAIIAVKRESCFFSKYLFLVVVMGCLASHSAIAQLTIFLQSQNPQCGGFASGTITAIVVGGQTPYSYLWSNGSTSNPNTNLLAGTYTLTVTDAAGLTNTASATLVAPPVLLVSIEITNCSSPGEMTAHVSGGIPPYEYLWSNGGTTDSIHNLGPGQYCVTVFDNVGCGYITCKSIGLELSANVATTPAVCGSNEGGTATATPSGGIPPFTYYWSNDSIGQTIEDLFPGFYEVTVTAFNGCTTVANGHVGILTGSLPVTLDITHPTCPGSSTGSISASVNGSTSELSFIWSNGDTTHELNNLPAGTYSVTVTNTLGCTGTKSATLTYQSNMTAVISKIDPSCSYSSNGSASVNPSGGLAPYTYLWSQDSTTASINNLPAGNYSVTVTDSLGCTLVKTATLTAPPPMSVLITTTNATQCGASNGSISAQPSGSSPPYTYHWSNGSNANYQNNLPAGIYAVTITSSLGCTIVGVDTIFQPHTMNINITGTASICPETQNGTLTANPPSSAGTCTYVWSNGATTKTINNLPAGTYAVTVTNAQGCEGADTASIETYPETVVELYATNAKCFNTPTGKITSLVSGGTPPFTYLWSNGATTSGLSAIPAGTYSVTVTDLAGCTQVQEASVLQPEDISVSFTGSGGSCGANGTLTANATGGTGAYQWAWSNGANTQTITGLAPGNYSVTVSDAKGCSKSASSNVPAFPQMNLSVTAYNTTCNGVSDGMASANISSGVPPFQYLWSNNEVTSTITNLSPGTYSVTATDANGCSSSGSATVALGTGLNVSISAIGYICETGTATIQGNAMGGSPPYSWEWSNGQQTQSITVAQPGTYTVTASDITGCFGTAVVTLQPAPAFSIYANTSNVTCYGFSDGSISLHVANGIPPYAFLWNTGQDSSFIGNLPPGQYTVTITDAAGCTKTHTTEISQPNALELQLHPYPSSCDSTGTISTLVSGGVQPLSFHWSNGATTPSLASLPPGDYTLTVTDFNGCKISDSATVLPPPPISCNVILVKVISQTGSADGQLTTEVNGGSPPFNFLWSNGQTSSTAFGLAPGEHSVTVTDVNNCESTCSFVLLNPAKVGDLVWHDLNEDGSQAADEPGVSGISIHITGVNNYNYNISDTIVTDASGKYAFVVQPGVYEIHFTRPAGYVFSPVFNTSDTTMDSNADASTGIAGPFTLGDGEVNLSIDAGLIFHPSCENVESAGEICCEQVICAGAPQIQPFTQTSPPQGGTGELEYQWFRSTLPVPFNPIDWHPIPGANSSSFTPVNLTETTWFLLGVKRENCTDYLGTNPVKVALNPLLPVEIVNPEFACTDTPIDVFCTPEVPGATYKWSFEGGTPATANTPSVQGITWSSTGVKTITLTLSKEGCVVSTTSGIHISNDLGSCLAPFLIVASKEGVRSALVEWNYPPPDSIGISFQVEWAWESNAFSSIGSPDTVWEESNRLYYRYLHKTPLTGRNFYRVKLETNHGDQRYSNVEELLFLDSFNLVHAYPNPMRDILKIEIFDRFDAQISFNLITVDGKIIGTYTAPSDNFSMEIDVKGLLPGVYFLQVNYDQKPQKIYKLVKKSP